VAAVAAVVALAAVVVPQSYPTDKRAGIARSMEIVRRRCRFETLVGTDRRHSCPKAGRDRFAIECMLRSDMLAA
jgi:hypothetical protein